MFYAPESRVTRDLDFVLQLELFGLPKASILTDIGFYTSNAAGTYMHDETPFTLEIVPGPLAVGGSTLATYDTFRKGSLVLHVISATDSVKDRLAHGAYFHDVNAVRQAGEVAKAHEVDLNAVRAWGEAEGAMHTYELFQTFYRA